MAYIIIPKPGSVTGPCLTACAHSDCAESLRMIATPCHRCGKPLGWGVKLAGEPLAHYLCELAAADEARHG